MMLNIDQNLSFFKHDFEMGTRRAMALRIRNELNAGEIGPLLINVTNSALQSFRHFKYF